MRVPVRLALLLCALCFILCSGSPMWTYHFVNKNLTWSEAQQFCRQHYHDLACVSSSEDNGRLPRPPGYSAPVWIGLYDDPTDLSQWRWAETNSSASFQVWWSSADEPQYIHQEQQCGALSQYGWFATYCTNHKAPCLCYSGSNPKVFHLWNHTMTWFEALSFCRTNHRDLAVIESSEENTAAVTEADSTWPWIGLHRSTGRWSDKRSVTFMTWHNLGPRQIYHQPFCVAENVNNSWEVSPCAEKRPFYCQEKNKSRRFVKIKFSAQDLSVSVITPDILDQMQKLFKAAGYADARITWKRAPKKEKELDEPEDCPSYI